MALNSKIMRDSRDGNTVVIEGWVALLISWSAASWVNAAMILATLPLVGKGAVRLQQLVFDAGHFLALALVSSGGAWVWNRLLRKKINNPLAADFGLLLLLNIGIAVIVVPQDLLNFSNRMAETLSADTILWLSVSVVALSVPTARIVVEVIRRFFWGRLFLSLCGISFLAANSIVLQRDYPAGHLYVTLIAVLMVSSAITGLKIPRKIIAPVSGFFQKRLLRFGAMALGAGLAVTSVALPPSPKIAVALLSSSGSVIPPYLFKIFGHKRRLPKEKILEEMRPWFESRKKQPPIPSVSKVLPKNGIVLYFSIEATRADLFNIPKLQPKLPTLFSLSSDSITFKNARSPGAQTVYTITSVFSAKYFSQMYWTKAKFDKNRDTFPHEDSSVRFPEILAAAHIPTVTFSASHWLLNAWGCVRGFTEETRIEPKKSYYTDSEPMADAVLKRLEEVEDGPLFLFTHFMDSHKPYDLSPVQGSNRDRWIGEIGMIDAQLKRILDRLDHSSLAGRTAVIITADHGESFGEHNVNTHGKTLYEHEVRVPLWFRLPSRKARVINEPVSLIDLGPTILDLMGQATPGHYMGQSLVPFLQGGSTELHRPIVAEAKLKKMMILPNEFKVIVDDKNHTEELYNLRTDPKEANNLVDDEKLMSQAVSWIRKFFKAHTLRRKGYSVPSR